MVDALSAAVVSVDWVSSARGGGDWASVLDGFQQRGERGGHSLNIFWADGWTATATSWVFCRVMGCILRRYQEMTMD